MERSRENESYRKSYENKFIKNFNYKKQLKFFIVNFFQNNVKIFLNNVLLRKKKMFNIYLNSVQIVLILFICFQLITVGEAGICWLNRMENNKCKNAYSRNITREECCGGVIKGAGYTEKDLSEVEFFFSIAIDDGAICNSCLESCSNANCGPNKRCVLRKGRPKCICSPLCKASKNKKNANGPNVIKLNPNYENRFNNNIKNKRKYLTDEQENTQNQRRQKNHSTQTNIDKITTNNNKNNNSSNNNKYNNNKKKNKNDRINIDNKRQVLSVLNNTFEQNDKLILNSTNNKNNHNNDNSNHKNGVRHHRKKERHHHNHNNRTRINNNNNNQNINNYNNHNHNNNHNNNNNNDNTNYDNNNKKLDNLNSEVSNKRIKLNDNNNLKNSNENKQSSGNENDDSINGKTSNTGQRQKKNSEKHQNENHNNNTIFHEKIGLEEKIRTGYFDSDIFLQSNPNYSNDFPNHGRYYNPVCGTDGKTYKTECQLKKRACRQDNNMLTVAYRGHCQTSCTLVKCLKGEHCLEDQNSIPHCVSCIKKCPSEEKLSSTKSVCAIDGHTYPSLCHLKLKGCMIGRGIPVAYRGPCVDAANCNNVKCKDRQICLTDLISQKPRCVSCSFKCPRKRRPPGMRAEDVNLCGSNNKTYYSWCQMMKDSCQTKYFIDLKHTGACKNDSFDESSS